MKFFYLYNVLKPKHYEPILTHARLFIIEGCYGHCDHFLIIICEILRVPNDCRNSTLSDRIFSLAFDVISRVLETGPVSMYTK